MYADASLKRTALDHLWLHFTEMGSYGNPDELQVMVRGDGCYALELVRDKDARESFSEEERHRLLRGFLSPRLFERGLLCRADDRGEPVVQISPPLVARQEQFDEIAGILGGVLEEAGERMAVAA